YISVLESNVELRAQLREAQAALAAVKAELAESRTANATLKALLEQQNKPSDSPALQTLPRQTDSKSPDDQPSNPSTVTILHPWASLAKDANPTYMANADSKRELMLRILYQVRKFIIHKLNHNSADISPKECGILFERGRPPTNMKVPDGLKAEFVKWFNDAVVRNFAGESSIDEDSINEGADNEINDDSNTSVDDVGNTTFSPFLPERRAAKQAFKRIRDELVEEDDEEEYSHFKKSAVKFEPSKPSEVPRRKSSLSESCKPSTKDATQVSKRARSSLSRQQPVELVPKKEMSITTTTHSSRNQQPQVESILPDTHFSSTTAIPSAVLQNQYTPPESRLPSTAPSSPFSSISPSSPPPFLDIDAFPSESDIVHSMACSTVKPVPFQTILCNMMPTYTLLPDSHRDAIEQGVCLFLKLLIGDEEEYRKECIHTEKSGEGDVKETVVVPEEAREDFVDWAYEELRRLFPGVEVSKVA
ncbi:hypothetical protein HDU99_003841, partial [Rhizoclosmatium hyalinum]